MWKKGNEIKGGNTMNQPQPQYKPEEPVEEPVEQPQPQPEVQETKKEELKAFLLHITDGESAEKIIVGAATILEALTVFAGRYQEVCADWQLMNISIEEIEILQ